MPEHNLDFLQGYMRKTILQAGGITCFLALIEGQPGQGVGILNLLTDKGGEWHSLMGIVWQPLDFGGISPGRTKNEIFRCPPIRTGFEIGDPGT
jgi:hypothetical protein